MARCPFANWTPVDFHSKLANKQSLNAVVLHTNGGGANLVPWFNQQYAATRQRIGCTFQVYKDGRVDQLADTMKVIYAEYGLSTRAVSIETEDDGNPTIPWTPQQVTTIVELIQWLNREFEVPTHLMQNPEDGGIGYHEQFPIYNQSGHSCPGSVRQTQLVHQVLTQLGQKPKPTPKPKPEPTSHAPAPTRHLPLPFGVFDSDTATWQRQMAKRGWTIAADGVYGAGSKSICQQFQKDKKLAVDGVVGPATWAAAWNAPVS